MIMVDGVGTDVPAILQRFGRVHPVQGYLAQPGVLPYIPWTTAQLAEFPMGHYLTASLADRPHDAKDARELDVERYDATTDDVAPWLISRHEFGHDDGQIYVDMSGLLGVLEAIFDAQLWMEPWWRLRLAWYWGRPAAPTLEEVMQQARLWTAGHELPELDERRVWACQWFAGGNHDLNEVYGIPDFTRP